MKKNMVFISLLSIGCSSLVMADTKSAQTSLKKEESQKSVTAADILSRGEIMADARIAFVDSYAIMGESQQGQEARKEFESKRESVAKNIQEESKKLEKAKNEYVSKSTTMTDVARDKEEKKLVKMDRDLKNMLQENKEELELSMQRETEKLAREMDEGVTELAKKENLDIVFDRMTGRAIYVADRFDFTDKALKIVDNKYETKLAQNKKTATESATVKVAGTTKADTLPAKAGA